MQTGVEGAMTNEEKIRLINTLPVFDFDCDGETCNYVLIPVVKITRKTLNKLGCDDEYIDANTEGGLIDISSIGFKFANWWDSEEGFVIKGV